MLKLYRHINQELHYWETWEADSKSAIIHWGKVGTKGSTKKIKSGLFKNHRKFVENEIASKLEEGFHEPSEDDWTNLEIEYKIDGAGSESDLDKRHRLEQNLDSQLGWVGLGHCDGGSSGSGTMEVGCFVIDFDLAKVFVENELEGSEFADYSRIFKVEPNNTP